MCEWCAQHEAVQRGEIDEHAPPPVIRPWMGRREPAITLTHIIFGISAAVFLGMALGAQGIWEFPTPELVQWGANLGALTISGEWWRLLTNIFVHAGIIHIGFNMWCLWYLGELAEQLYGAGTYGCIYLICGLGASLTSAGWHPYVPSVGASGAIFGLAGALFTAIKLGEFSVSRAALSGTLRSLGAFVVYNLIFGFAISGVDNAAHIGGLITGAIVGSVVALVAPRRDQGARRAVVFVVLLFALAFCAMLLAHHYGVPLRLQAVHLAQP